MAVARFPHSCRAPQSDRADADFQIGIFEEMVAEIRQTTPSVVQESCSSVQRLREPVLQPMRT
ncbi:hypothetical protein AB4Z10_10445 [Bosea sp. RAF48]|uniref:hypothetical protein n=1 Tax=Bosea sp. RAF48 TaxID=3237480 RepID=UPI003F91457D